MKRLALLLILFAVPAQAWTRKPLFQVVPGSPFTGGAGGGGAPTFPLLAPNGTVAAPSYSFSGNTGQGIYRVGNSTMFAVAGVNAFAFNYSTIGDIVFPAAGQVGFSSTSDVTASVDAAITRIATGVVGSKSFGGTAYYFQVSGGRSVLAADFTNATATFSPTLLAPSNGVTTGRKYSFRLSIFFSDSTAADGAQFDFNGGTATSTNFIAQCVASNNVGGALVLTNAATTALATAVQVTLALTSQGWLQCSGTFEPSSTGTFIVRAAQTAHTAGTLTVNRGSYLWVEDMP